MFHSLLTQFAKKLLWRAVHIIWAGILIAPALAETITLLAHGDVAAWQYQTFDNITPTDYQRVKDDDLGHRVLLADSDRGASGYFRQMPINLQTTPWLHFQWRIDHAPDGFDEHTKAGDDFALRLYFTAKDGLGYQSLSLVRAQQPRGTQWRSPYASFINDMHVYALIGGDAPLGQWQKTHINLASLWQNIFDESPPLLGMVGFMTDGDSAGVQMRSRYGTIVLSDSPTSPF